MEFIGIDEARPVLGDLINKAIYRGEPTGISRHGKKAAVLVSYADWHDMRARLGLDVDGSAGGGEVVRRDGDPLDNDPSNLEIRKS